MFIAKVVGSVWATQKVAALENTKMLLIKRIDPLTGNFTGKIQMAVDNKHSAGKGDIVLVIDEGGSARQALDIPNAPIRTAIVGIVDNVDIAEKFLKKAPEKPKKRASKKR